jgi:DNA polymerase delta subunit 1
MENYYRKSVDFDYQSELKFHAIEWVTSDESFDEESPDEYIIRAFGVTEEGYNVCCSIRNFKPYFYIKVPEYWTSAHFKIWLKKILSLKKNGKSFINYYIKNTLLLNECKIEHHIPYYGFCNMEKSRFVRMVFSSQKGMKGYMYALKSLVDNAGGDNKLYMQLYDTNMDTLLKFFHLNSIQPSNHIKVDKFYKDDSSRCQIDVECDYTNVLPDIKQVNYPFLQASYDIETYSTPEMKEGREFYPFPVPENKDNPVYQIATTFKKLGDPDFFVKNLLTLKTCSKIEDENIVVIECKNEKDLLLKWIQLIKNMSPDMIYSYNGNMFDDNYIWVRCGLLGIQNELGTISKLKDYQAKIKEATFSSSAYGTSEYKRLDIPGTINYDILITIRREFKENSYKLDSISEKYIGEKKNPVTVVEIFKAYESGDPDKIKSIGNYCVQDTRLPQLLVDKLHILQGQISMSNITYVTIKMLIERGQEVKSLSKINMTSKSKGFLIPHMEYSNNIKGFEGALVLTPVVGLYSTITVVDFEGLYPSIIRAHNLCFTSVVLNEEYLNLPGIEYIEVKFSEDEPPAIFVKNTETVLPTLLIELYNERKRYKKLMKESGTSELKQIYDRNQLAVKVTANSIYGVLGSKTIGCRVVAASVTHFGREMLKDTKKYIENNHHSVYPEDCDSNVLDEDKHVTIKDKLGERKLKVKELLSISGECLIKTDSGWRDFLGLEQVV